MQLNQLNQNKIYNEKLIFLTEGATKVKWVFDGRGIWVSSLHWRAGLFKKKKKSWDWNQHN